MDPWKRTRGWGIHGRRPQFEMVRDGIIALERPGVGDLHELGDDRDAVFTALRRSYPHEPDGTIRTWTTVLLWFAFGPGVCDLVVHPDPLTRTVSVGRIASGYRFEPGPRERHVRDALWLLTGYPREALSESARREISRRTAFFPLDGSAAELAARSARR